VHRDKLVLGKVHIFTRFVSELKWENKASRYYNAIYVLVQLFLLVSRTALKNRNLYFEQYLRPIRVLPRVGAAREPFWPRGRQRRINGNPDALTLCGKTEKRLDLAKEPAKMRAALLATRKT
jgi:hypothetical protein